MNIADDPSIAWDRHCDAMYQLYESEYYGAFCADCKHCKLPGRHYYTDKTVAYCTAWVDDFVYTTDTPSDYECESYEPRRQ